MYVRSQNPTPIIPVFVPTAAIDQRITQININQYYQLPPQAPPSYGSQLYAIPQPTPYSAAPPAGRGVTGAPKDEGWPQPSYRTAGGYTVVFDGHDQSMKIYGPDQKPGDKPLANIWGDPHVQEGDGTRWDFSENGDMILPDGTMLAVNTTQQDGHPLIDSVNIVNGADHVEVSGIAQDKPQAGFISNDGYSWRGDHVANEQGTDARTYVMGDRDGQDVTFNLFVRGVDQGEISGAHFDDDKNAYVQETDGGHLYQIDPKLLPPLGSPAWGNMVRSEAIDQLATQDPQFGAQYGVWLGQDHAASATGPGYDWGGAMPAAQGWGAPGPQDPNAWGVGPGGWGGIYPNFQYGNAALGDMGNIALLQGQSASGMNQANPLGYYGPGGAANGFGAPGGNWPYGQAMPAPAGDHVIQNSDIAREAAHQAQVNQVLKDPSLSVEDKVMLVLMLIMKKMDDDIEGQANYIGRSQQQQAGRNGPTQGGTATQQNPGVTNGTATEGANSPSVDVETSKLDRMVKKRGQMFEMLRGIITKYDETAKNVTQAIGR